MRSGIGWSTAKSTGAFSWEDLGVSVLADRTTNEIVDGVSAGFDARLQLARLGRPRVRVDEGGQTETVTPPRRLVPMQLEPYVRADLLDWLDLEASWAAGPSTFSQAEPCSRHYPGQSCFTAEAAVELGPTAPRIRAGMFQPSFGIRHDDHTNLIRHDAGRGDQSTLIPPNYAELGAELNWQPVRWIEADAAAFLADNLAEAIGERSILEPTSPGGSLRVTFSPRLDTDEIGSFYSRTGSSALAAGEFLMLNGFFGVGWLDRASLLVEAAHLRFGGRQERDGWNFSSTISVPIWDWLVPSARAGYATTNVAGTDADIYSATVGVEFFPLPWIELRPEYRFRRTNEWQMGQYTAQLHLFY